MNKWLKSLLVFSFGYAEATITVMNTNSSGSGSLADAVSMANISPDTIQFSPSLTGQTISLIAPLMITNTYTIDGQTYNIVVSGATEVPPFFVTSGSPSISNLTISSGAAQGAAGGDVQTVNGGGAGGGGGGLGGGCFADASIQFTNVMFVSNVATGGVGGSVSNVGTMLSCGGGGGGGMGGAGGVQDGNGNGGAGGGGELPSQPGSTESGNSGGSGGGNGGAGGNGQGAIGGPTVGGIGGRYSGGGGSGQTTSGAALAGGAGGYGGGGGGEGDSTASQSGAGGGTGGVGGGGGGASENSTSMAGSVFGGGNGGSNSVINSGMPGGGGGGLGGALFVSNQSTTTLNYTTQTAANGAFSGNNVAAGNPGTTTVAGTTNATAGSALGKDLFIDQNGTLAFDLSSGITLSPPNPIASNTNGLSTIQNIGPGILDLSAAAHAFYSTLDMQAGTVYITAANNLGNSNSVLNFDGGMLEVATNTFSSPQSATLSTTATIQTDSGAVWTLGGNVTGSGPLTKTGSGTLILGGSNSYTSGTDVSAGTLTVSSASNLGGSTAGFTLGGGTLHATGNVTTSGDVSVTSSSTMTSDVSTTLTLSGTLTGSSGATLTLSGAGTNSIGAVAVNSSDIFTISGAIGGSQGLAKSGTGALILQGSNSYTGATSVTDGSLILQNSGAVGSSSGVTVSSGGTLNLSAESGAISVGSIPLSLVGTGFSNEGALTATAGLPVYDSSYAGAISLQGDTTINSNGSPLTLSGAISESTMSELTFGGGGTVILTNTNIYSGGTIIECDVEVTDQSNVGGNTAALTFAGGTLDSANAFTTSGPVSVTDNSTFSSALGSVLSGVLTGSNSTTLTLFQLGTTSIEQVAVNNTDSFTILGVMGGSNPLTKTGTGTLILPGQNVYTGLTTVSAGRVNVIGSIAGGILVDSGATLGGTGTVGGGGTINGNLSPGTSIGTLTFDTSSGSVTLGPTSVTNIEINSLLASSEIIITGPGHIDLAGTVNLIQDAGSYPPSGVVTFLSGAYAGTFNPTVTGALPGFTFTLDYGANVVQLIYGFIPVVVTIPTQGLSGNQLKVANYLNNNGSTSTLELFEDLSGSSLKSALNSVSPARNAFPTYVAAQTAFSISDLVSNHVDSFRMLGRMFSEERAVAIESMDSDSMGGYEEGTEVMATLLFDVEAMEALTADSSDNIDTPVKSNGRKNKFSAWISGFGEYSHQSASLQNPSFNFISEAVLAGLDYKGENRSLAGGAIGYAHSHYNDDHSAGHGNINYYFASLYGNGYIGNFYLTPAVWGLFNQVDNTRRISFPGFSEKAKADIFSWQLVPHLEVGYDIEFSWGDMIPFTSADWAISWQRGYTEHGASPFNARQKAKATSMVRSETGLKFCEKWTTSWGAFYLKEKASYVFEKPFGTGTVNSAFVGTPGAFTVTAVNQNLNLGAVGLNFLFAVGKEKPVTVDFGYEGEFGANYWSSELQLTIAKDF